MKKKSADVKRLTYLALLTAIVVLFQSMGKVIPLGPFATALALVPITIGAIKLGSLCGAWLGLVFAFVVLVSGDASLFFTFNPIGTVVTVIAKSILCGFVTGLVYKLCSKKLPDYLSSVIASIICPIVNTAVFVIGCFTFFFSDMGEIGTMLNAPPTSTPIAIIFITLIGFNFFFEILLNAVVSPIISKALNSLEVKNDSYR